MKIAVWHNLPSGGGKRALYDHMRGLVARGHTVEAWCPPTADLSFLPLAPMAREHVVDLQWTTPFRRLDEWQVTLQIERSLQAMTHHCQECARQIDRGGFDVLFANSCHLTGSAPIARFATLPAALYLQEPFRPLYEAQPRLRWLAPARGASRLRVSTYRRAFADMRQNRNWRVQAREEVESAAAFDRILVNSHFSRESVLRSYGLDADVCYLGLDTTTFVDRHRPREGFVVGLSSIQPHKNVTFCIRAIAAVAPPRPALVWIGNVADKGYLHEMQALAQSLGVAFHPRVGVDDEELIETLNRAMAMVYAPRLEPFGLSPLEANACGAPVVAVAEGGVRETIVDGENGFLVRADPAAMAEAITRLRDDPDLACRLGETARRLVERNWSLDQSIDRIERHLTDVATRSVAN